MSCNDSDPDGGFECECRLGADGGPCFAQFDDKQIADHRIDYLSCDYWDDHCYNLLNERIIAIMSVLVNIPEKNHHDTKQVKASTKFLWRGRPVCKKLFLYVHGIKKPKWTYLKKRYLRFGVEPRQHQNKSHPVNSNAISGAERKAIVDFIRDFAKRNALNPHSASGLTMSSELNVKLIYRDFKKHFSQRKISYETFRNVWRSHCSDIKFAAKNDKTLIVEFIRSYAKRNGQTTESKECEWTPKDVVLGSEHNVKLVYAEFKKTYDKEISYDVFNTTWKTCCPHIRFENSAHYNKRKCSHCGVDGHTNRKIGQHFLCPLRESESGLSGLMRKAVRKS